MIKLLIFTLTLYKKTQPLRHLIYNSLGIPTNSCRHQPTCSIYSINAIRRYGTIVGSKIAIKRLLNCRPGTVSNND